MCSKTKRIGDIGEANIIANLLKYDNVHVSKPFGENCQYDLIIDINGKLYRTQVKTTEKVKDGKMIFSVCSTDAYNLKITHYTKEDIDLFAFYCIENNFCGLAKIEEVGHKAFTIRTEPTKSGRKKDVNDYIDFQLDSKIKEL